MLEESAGYFCFFLLVEVAALKFRSKRRERKTLFVDSKGLSAEDQAKTSKTIQQSARASQSIARC